MSGQAAPQVWVEYRARVFHQNPLYRVLYDHYSHFQKVYPTRFQVLLGLFRSCVDHTVERFLVCGDPREGVAVYTCDACSQKKIVPFSCKTRLFCPSCHQKRILLWAEDLIEHTLADVSHRFWTFSIPKRLRPYFLHDRKLLKHLVFAAHRTFSLALGNGRIQKH
ncbi:MAG TPA: transposase zinc-binding domain-containing protein, partial [Bdellovibrionota bacterium]|nr:transposase zinc-binding domain-containing protein [Bdellovibrionota bacterium]